ncbi:MAG: SpoIIE family protein phosphatase [Roseburia sp.]|nr:SpoIIE family protein phosphatase [Anaeroplasma bactoclasticum]MCM1195773.1 SpoIIE family protein phosphatase [Roseburia sp.]MCM1557709.1 SpoIIE family protein phosphatase [Anaeroplasma bactoclasticum]
MRKYALFALHYCFYIASLLFLPKDISIFTAGFLISILALENIWFTILPLSIAFYLPLSHTYILIAVLTYHVLLYPFIKKNRYYALGVFGLSSLTTFTVLYILQGFQADTLKIMLYLFVIYGIINALHVFQKIEHKNTIIPYQQKLIDLTILLGYFFIIFYYCENTYIMYFLFMQLFLIRDFKYNLVFIFLYALLLAIKDYTQLSIILLPTAISYMPITIVFTFTYKNIIWVFGMLYSILITILPFTDKKLTIEQNYINTLFDDFNKYISNLNTEYNKNVKIKELKEKKFAEISKTYCANCNKNSLCRTKLEKRYSFLSAAMLGFRQNVYNCPYYNRFVLDANTENINKSFEYSAMKSLSFELSYLYNQSLSLKKEYEKFISLLYGYGYPINALDINLASSSLYFSIQLDTNKPIIESLFLRCAYKAFGERLEMKQNKEQVYFFKKPQLKITYAHTILAKEGNLMSGDNYYIKKDFNNSYVFALSDGMGSGYTAYTESIDALKTISTLSSYHFRTKTILKLLEDIYELRSNYDRYATLDFLSINPANRKMNLYKMGSSTTYILHNQKLLTYENQALPLKLDDVNSAYELDVFSGDFIFLLSDGIGDFISNKEFEALVNPDQTAEEACYSIVNYLKKKEKGRLKDDLSLIVIKAIS